MYCSHGLRQQEEPLRSCRLEVSLAKRLSHGLQFLVSYTFSKALDTDGADVDAVSSAMA